MSIGIVCAFLLLGILSGLLGGLIGIGGGPVIVPGLVLIFTYVLKFPSDYVMHYAIATSLGAIFITICSAVFVHHQHGDVRWQITKKMSAFVLLGVVSGALVATLITSKWLMLSFAIFVWLPIYKMLHLKKQDPHKVEENHSVRTVGPLGLFSGFMSGLLGIGGGIFTVPLLCHLGIPVRFATGTSLSLGMFSTFAGTLTFLFLEPKISTVVPNTIGFVYWPALLLIGMSALIFAPIGVKLSRILSERLISRIFSIFLVFVSVKMFIMFGFAEGVF
jgi:uncharacterized membrane protein YfcA